MTPVAPLNAITEVKNSLLDTVACTAALEGEVAIIRRATCGRSVVSRRWAALCWNILRLFVWRNWAG